MKKTATHLLVLILILLFNTVSAQNINTIAGGLGDNGAATAGKLFNPNNVAVDRWGNVYVADYGNNSIRKITPAGIIKNMGYINQPLGVCVDTVGNVYATTTSRAVVKMNEFGTFWYFAGNGSSGWSGDGGQATAAKTSANAIACDRNGNLYISDVDNRRIRKVNALGIISTIAGTGSLGIGGEGIAATSAPIGFVTGICADNAGNVFLAENDNNRVRKIAPSGIISTFAGNGIIGYAGDGGPATAANFNKVYGVCVDSFGNVFIADNSNNEIRMVNTSGIITRVGGAFVSGGFSGDGGPATIAQLSNPTGTATDNFGNFYIADKNNHRIRKASIGGVIYTIAGSSMHLAQGYAGDGGQAISASLNSPMGMTYDTSHNMYIADQSNHVIRKINTSGLITTVAGNNTYGFSGDNAAATAAQLYLPEAVATDKKGNLFICDQGNNRIRMVNSIGIITTLAGSDTAGFSGDGGAASAASLSSPSGISADKYGNLYVTDLANHRIRKIDTNHVITTVAGNGTAGYFGDGGAAIASQLNQPRSIYIDKSGNIFITDNGNWRIRKIDTSGIITTVAGGGTGPIGGLAIYAALPQQPVGVCVDDSGQIYVAVSPFHVYRVNTAGIITNLAGNNNGFSGDGGPATSAALSLGYSSQVGMMTDEKGNLLLSDVANDRIRIVYNASVSISTPNTTICTGSGATFTAVAAAASGFSPFYQWQKNGINVGTNSPLYTALGITNGDKILCRITDGPSGTAIATSNQIVMTVVSPTGAPALSVTYSGAFTPCAGTTVTCTPYSVVNGGTSPVFTWYKNGTAVFTGSPFVFVPINHDTVYCKLTSSITCLSVDTAVSLKRGFTVIDPGYPSILIQGSGASGTITVCSGNSINCNIYTTTLGGGSNFQWYKNGIYQITSSNYNFIPANGDLVNCKMTTNATCVLTDTAMSNTLAFVVTSPSVPTVSFISDKGDTVCPGSSVQCIASSTFGGSSPTYLWYKNSIYVSGSSSYVFTPLNGDILYCSLNSNASCVSTTTAISLPVTFTYAIPQTSSVTITKDVPDTICAGTPATYTANPINGGTTPNFDWYKNNTRVFIGNPYSFVPNNTDKVFCELTSSECVAPATIASNTIQIAVKSHPVPNVITSVSPSSTVCHDVPVTITATAVNGGPTPVYDWFRNGDSVFSGNPFTFTPNDNDNVYTRLTSNAECVTNPAINSEATTFHIDAVPEITISCTPGQVVFKGTTVTLVANVIGNSAYQLQWVKNGEPIPGATNSTYTSDQFSTWDSVKCILTAYGTCIGTATSNTLAVNTYHSMKLYPDPNDGHFIINGNNYDANGDRVTIRIYNTEGKLVYEKQADFNAITFYTEIDLGREFPAGVYVLRLSYSLESRSFLFVVKH